MAVYEEFIFLRESQYDNEHSEHHLNHIQVHLRPPHYPPNPQLQRRLTVHRFQTVDCIPINPLHTGRGCHALRQCFVHQAIDLMGSSAI